MNQPKKPSEIFENYETSAFKKVVKDIKRDKDNEYARGYNDGAYEAQQHPALKGERRRIIEQLREEVRAEEKANWLRSEIEKLDGMKLNNEDNPYYHKFAKLLDGGKSMDDYQHAYNNALTSIITRYKEELLELDKTIGL